jgi:hypothetical protein
LEAAILSRIRSARNLALELREGQQDIQREASHRGGGVELLRHRNEGDPVCVEGFDHLGEVGERAGQPVNLVDHDHIDRSVIEIGHQPLQGRALHRGARETTVVVLRFD